MHDSSKDSYCSALVQLRKHRPVMSHSRTSGALVLLDRTLAGHLDLDSARQATRCPTQPTRCRGCETIVP